MDGKSCSSTIKYVTVSCCLALEGVTNATLTLTKGTIRHDYKKKQKTTNHIMLKHVIMHDQSNALWWKNDHRE